jgi:hypothetical protein
VKRTDFYHDVEITYDNTLYKELDFLWNSLSEFQMKRRPNFYRVSSIDLKRPYLISFRFYGDVRFWWIICLVNNISNVFTDLKVGDMLSIPSPLDIYDFQKAYRVRRT